MIIDDDGTYYDLLELAPDASPQELRAAYLRAKSAYRKDSVALYTLITPEETEFLLRKIEEAYQILSNPEKRRDYDRNHGLLSMDTFDEEALRRSAPAKNQKIVSIDRVPPMEHTASETDILVPPATDFTAEDAPFASERASREEADRSGPPPKSSPAKLTPNPSPEGTDCNTPLFNQAILQEVEWRGQFLRSIREARRVSLEELSDYTKITRTYLTAIEDEAYHKLPAPVYLRGFLAQIAKYLKLPSEKVTSAYLARHNQALQGRKK